MPDPTSIFQDDKTQTPAQTTTAPTDQLATMLAGIKNESGEQKYKSVEDALKALQHSQAYIPQLTQTLAEREAELAQARQGLSKVEELERAVQQLMTPSAKEPETKPTAASSIAPSEIAEIVNRTLQENRTKETANSNIGQVIQTVKQVFGDKSEEMFYGKAATLGLSKEAVNTLAATSPEAVYALLGINKNAPAKPLSGFNSDGFQPSKETFISKNAKPALIGASSQDLLEEGRNARKMVEELNAQGLNISALTDPKVYFKYFK